jgi:hypothetical protein
MLRVSFLSRMLVAIVALVLAQTAVQSAELSSPGATPHALSRPVALVPAPVPHGVEMAIATRPMLALRRSAPTPKLETGWHFASTTHHPHARPVAAARRSAAKVLSPAPMPVNLKAMPADEWVLISA